MSRRQIFEIIGDLIAIVALFAGGWAFLVIGHGLGW